MDTNEQLTKFAFALTSTIRITILQKLADQSCCYHGDFSEEFSIAKSSLSQHLKILKEAGLIQGEIKTPKTKYCINKQNWKLAQQLFDDFFKER